MNLCLFAQNNLKLSHFHLLLQVLESWMFNQRPLFYFTMAGFTETWDKYIIFTHTHIQSQYFKFNKYTQIPVLTELRYRADFRSALDGKPGRYANYVLIYLLFTFIPQTAVHFIYKQSYLSFWYIHWLSLTPSYRI